MGSATVGHLTSASRTADDVLAEARALVEPAYRAVVDTARPQVRHVAGYHAGWWDEHGAPMRRSGKSVRPALVFAAAAAVGARDMQTCLPEAVAVELVHDFSLIHDDLMDGDTERRHRPSAWTMFGTGDALLTGDTLLALAINELAGRASMTTLANALVSLCAGQSDDLDFESRTSVELSDCMTMIEGKTASLLACACEIGATGGGADHARAALLAQFGHHLGIAFQLTDDILGIWGNPVVTGKPVFSDLVNRKKSPPVVVALQANAQFRELYDTDPAYDDPIRLRTMADLIEACGARAWAEEQAEQALTEARVCVDALDCGEDAADLRRLADFICGRSR